MQHSLSDQEYPIALEVHGLLESKEKQCMNGGAKLLIWW
jgi:hypothetical protein